MKKKPPLAAAKRSPGTIVLGVAAIVLVLSLLLFSRQPRQQTPAVRTDYLAVASAAMEGFRLEEAEASLRLHLAQQPGSGPARYELRWLYFNQFREREVEALLEDRLRQAPSDFSAAVDLLMSEFRPQVPREVLGYWEQVNRRQPGQASVLAALGYCHWQVGDIEHAKEELRAAINLRPDDVRIGLLVAEFLIELSDSKTAELLLGRMTQAPQEVRGEAFRDEALKRYADRIWWLRSRLAETRGDFEQALRHSEQSLALRPAELKLVQHHGALLQLLGRQDEAAGYFTEANQLEACLGRLTEIVLAGSLDDPSPALCLEVSELCDRRGKKLQGDVWRRAAAAVTMMQPDGR